MEIVALTLIAVGLAGALITAANRNLTKPAPPKVYEHYRFESDNHFEAGAQDYHQQAAHEPPPFEEPVTKEDIANDKKSEANLAGGIYQAQAAALEHKCALTEQQIELKKWETELQREEKRTEHLSLDDELERERKEMLGRKQTERDMAELEAEIREFLDSHGDPAELSELERQAAEAMQKIRLDGLLTIEQIKSFLSQTQTIEEFKMAIREKYQAEDAERIIDAFEKILYQNKTL